MMKTISEEQTADYKWFCEKTDDLFKHYGHCYLAIKNKDVLGRYDTFEQAVDDMEGKEPDGTFIIQECTDDPDGNTDTVMTMGIRVI